MKECTLIREYIIKNDYLLFLWPHCLIHLRLFMSNLFQCYMYVYTLGLSIDKETQSNKLLMLNDQWAHFGSCPFSLLNRLLLINISLNQPKLRVTSRNYEQCSAMSAFLFGRNGRRWLRAVLVLIAPCRWRAAMSMMDSPSNIAMGTRKCVGFAPRIAL